MLSPSIGRFKQAQRTDNLRLLRFQLFVDLAEAIVGTQVDDQCCQLIVADPATQLAVERVPGGLLEWIFVDVFERTMQLRRRGEEVGPDGVNILLQPRIGFAPRARSGSQLAADAARLLFHNMLDSQPNQVVLLWRAPNWSGV